MSPDVLHRKLQKKKKRKQYRKCPKCGYRMAVRLRWNADDGEYLEAECSRWPSGDGGCGFTKKLSWSGGGKADAYPAKAE